LQCALHHHHKPRPAGRAVETSIKQAMSSLPAVHGGNITLKVVVVTNQTGNTLACNVMLPYYSFLLCEQLPYNSFILYDRFFLVVRLHSEYEMSLFCKVFVKFLI
jgi:hypothetical protein